MFKVGAWKEAAPPAQLGVRRQFVAPFRSARGRRSPFTLKAKRTGRLRRVSQDVKPVQEPSNICFVWEMDLIDCGMTLLKHGAVQLVWLWRGSMSLHMKICFGRTLLVDILVRGLLLAMTNHHPPEFAVRG